MSAAETTRMITEAQADLAELQTRAKFWATQYKKHKHYRDRELAESCKVLFKGFSSHVRDHKRFIGKLKILRERQEDLELKESRK